MTLWQVDGAGAVAQLDNIAGNGIASLDVGSYRDGTFIQAGNGATRTVTVIEVAGDQLTQTSTYNLQGAGFCGDVAAVKSFEVDGIRLVVVVTGIGEILLMGMGADGTLQLSDSWEWVDHGMVPIRNANDIELVFTDGQAVMVIAGTRPQAEASLEGVSVFTIGTADDTLTGGADEDDILGLGGSDRLYGGKDGDTVLGGSGVDKIGGGLGGDVLNGGSGDDIIMGNEGADSMEGGFGRDTVSYEGATGRVNINLDTGAVSGKGALGDIVVNFERVTGSRFADTLTGDDVDNELFGGDGGDKLNGGAGNDTLNGLSGDDTVNGDAGDDVISGSSGINQLSGGDGNDRVQFGSGADYLRGGAGADEFRWIPTQATIGRIFDFTQGEDRIDVSAVPAFVTAENLFDLLETVGGVHTVLMINGDRGIIIRNIIEAELTLDDFIF